MNIIEERTVGPSLGKDNIERVLTPPVGFCRHRHLHADLLPRVRDDLGRVAGGERADAGGAVVHAASHLTLPGIAAIALTLGMAIDANVLINERVREEVRNGVTPQAAIKAGYDHAWATILDSNITTLIAGLALLILARARCAALPWCTAWAFSPDVLR